MFNQIITWFGVPQFIVTENSSHFQNQTMSVLSTRLEFRHENSSPYYPQANGQVEAINKVLKTMIQHMVGKQKSSWYLKLYSKICAYRTLVKNVTGFTPFHLVYGLEFVLPIECKIPSLKLAIELLPNTTAEKERLLYLMQRDESRRDASLVNEANNMCIKV